MFWIGTACPFLAFDTKRWIVKTEIVSAQSKEQSMMPALRLFIFRIAKIESLSVRL